MKADSKLIEWLINNETQYRISKETGISNSTISGLLKGDRKIENLTLKIASKLTDFAKKLKKIEKNS